MYLFTEDCLIGVPEIDSEHERLFEIINEIQALLEEDIKSDQYDRICELLGHLKLYAKEHFQHEESYMERIHHPELELQRHQHSIFCDKINEADILLSGSDQTRFLEDLLKYLITWLYRHIIGCDLMIGKMKPTEAGKKIPSFTNEYLTGIDLIDGEHKELFRIIGEVHRVIQNEFIADKYDEIVYLLDELKNYTKFHFSDEEKYMQSIQYEGLDAQRRAHDAFVARLEEMDFHQIEGHQQETLEEILEFLTDWLINHILNSDKKIGGTAS